MTPKLWAVALLSVVSVPALFPHGAFALTWQVCEEFSERGLLTDVTLQECCREHPALAPLFGCTDAGFSGGTSHSPGFSGGGDDFSRDPPNVLDTLDFLNRGRGSPTGPGAPQGSDEDRIADTSGAGAAQRVVDTLKALQGGRSSPTAPGAPQGLNDDR